MLRITTSVHTEEDMDISMDSIRQRKNCSYTGDRIFQLKKKMMYMRDILPISIELKLKLTTAFEEQWQ